MRRKIFLLNNHEYVNRRVCLVTQPDKNNHCLVEGEHGLDLMEVSAAELTPTQLLESQKKVVIRKRKQPKFSYNQDEADIEYYNG